MCLSFNLENVSSICLCKEYLITGLYPALAIVGESGGKDFAIGKAVFVVSEPCNCADPKASGSKTLGSHSSSP